MMTDPIADMLTRIRNAAASKHATVEIPFSKLKLTLANLLSKERYVGAVSEATKNGAPVIVVELAYSRDGKAAIEHLSRVSKPGRRVYRTADKLPVVLDGYGIAVISTPAGLLTNRQAKKAGLGGEVVCTVY
ncbi:MAG: 30S ribosomal protein S8 [Parcubacteria group bacterium]|nr:30S ribosomal protein S8 [Parcubacteria group bacterium]